MKEQSKIPDEINNWLTGERQHWIVSVQDSINDYREIQGGYFDGSRDDAAAYFRHSLPWARYFGDSRYQITMKANSVVLQSPGETS